jgi:hypothetical protein
MSQIITGVFLQALKWSMQDERTGREMTGCTVRIGTPCDGTEWNKTKGMRIEKFTGPEVLYDKIDGTMVGKQVDLHCDIKGAGSKVKLVPVDMLIAKQRGAA